MEDTIFMAVLIAVILGAAFQALGRARTMADAEEWEREFLRSGSGSGGGGTPFQPLRAHQQKYLCGKCNLPFLFITFEAGPATEPSCPFCHSKEARRADDDETQWTPEPVSCPAAGGERERSRGGPNGERSPASDANSPGANTVTDKEQWEEAWRRHWSSWN